MRAAPNLMLGSGIEMFEQYAGALTTEQRRAVGGWPPALRERSAVPAARGGAFETGGRSGPIATAVVDVLRDTNTTKPIIAFYAAGIGVRFLLVSCAGAGGATIEEHESGTVERLPAPRLGMSRLLFGTCFTWPSSASCGSP